MVKESNKKKGKWWKSTVNLFSLGLADRHLSKARYFYSNTIYKPAEKCMEKINQIYIRFELNFPDNPQNIDKVLKKFTVGASNKL